MGRLTIYRTCCILPFIPKQETEMRIERVDFFEGASKTDQIRIKFSEIVAKLGEPDDPSSDGKSWAEWWVRLVDDEGNTIHQFAIWDMGRRGFDRGIWSVYNFDGVREVFGADVIAGYYE
jgi:hypothetical protein